jgi:Uncharacterized conserved protein
MRLAVRVTPKGGRDAVDGWAVDDAGRTFLSVRIAAPPSDGAANAALLAFLAKRLGRPKSALRILSGETSRLKIIEADGLDEGAADAAFGPRPPPS